MGLAWVNAKRVWYLMLLAAAILFLSNGVPFVYSDGFYYYHIAKSLSTYGTFYSPEKPEYFDYKGHAIAFYKGKYVEVVTPGGGLALWPGIAAAKLFRQPGQNIYTDYFLAFNGHTLADGLSVLVTATIAGLLGLVFSYKALRALSFSEKLSLFSVGTVYLSSFALWYVFLAPAFTHTYELLAMSIYLWGIVNYYRYLERKYLGYVGLAIAFAFLLRPIFAFMGIAIGLVLLWQRQWRSFLTVFLGSLPGIVVWLIYNYVTYGSFLTTGYTEIRGETFTSNFNAHNLLLSPYRGWFIYSPICVLGVIGLLLYIRKSRALAFVCLACITSLVIIYGYWGAWWGGGSFGQRFLVCAVPLVSLGVAYFVQQARSWKFNARKVLLFLILMCVAWSGLLTLLYRFTPVAQLKSSTVWEANMFAADRYTPIDMIDYHLGLIRNSQSLGGYLASVYKSGNGGASLAVVLLGASDLAMRLDEREPGVLKLHVLAPPVVRQQIPEKLVAYLVPKDSAEVTQIELSNIAVGKQYQITCSTDACSAGGLDVSVSKAVDYPKQLPRERYTAINPDTYTFTLYFYRPDNMQIKGNPIYLPPDRAFFELP